MITKIRRKCPTLAAVKWTGENKYDLENFMAHECPEGRIEIGSNSTATLSCRFSTLVLRKNDVAYFEMGILKRVGYELFNAEFNVVE